MNSKLRSGDLVEVRDANEILSSLDNYGALRGLPFMPEMLEFCGKRYRVTERIVQATMDALAIPAYSESYVREFKTNDVVFLEDLRCSENQHGGCQRGCRIFWKEAWLEKVEDCRPQNGSVVVPNDQVRPNLKTISDSGHYFCQSSQLEKATNNISSLKRLKKSLDAVLVGNCSFFRNGEKVICLGLSEGAAEIDWSFPAGQPKAYSGRSSRPPGRRYGRGQVAERDHRDSGQ